MAENTCFGNSEIFADLVEQRDQERRGDAA
jgi:hypothetical protein